MRATIDYRVDRVFTSTVMHLGILLLSHTYDEVSNLYQKWRINLNVLTSFL